MLSLLVATSCNKFGLLPFGGSPPPAKPDTIADNAYMSIKMAKDSINSDEFIFSFNHKASTAYVPGEDAPESPCCGIASIKSLVKYGTANVDLAIDTRPYVSGLNMPLDVACKKDTTYLIKIARWDTSHITGSTTKLKIPATIKIWLKDATTGDSVNLRLGAYHFTLLHNVPGGSTPNRFSLVMH